MWQQHGCWVWLFISILKAKYLFMNKGFIIEHTGQRSNKENCFCSGKKTEMRKYGQNRLTTCAVSRKQCLKFPLKLVLNY